MTSTYPSIHVEDTLKITVGCLVCAYPSIHFSLDEDTLRDHGRLPQVHIQAFTFLLALELSRSRSVARCAHIQAFATKTCTRVGLLGPSGKHAGCGHVHPCCRLCLHKRSTAALVSIRTTLTFRALRRNHLVWTPFEAIAFTTSPETTKKILFFL